jgi:hypothetical protein
MFACTDNRVVPVGAEVGEGVQEMSGLEQFAGVNAEFDEVELMGASADVRRCWGCRKLWPRTAMRWGSVTEGPLFFPRTVRVLRCPDCLA